ncbi:hypothetical protein B0H13DRAFT_1864738 [Mycena leptocephala]|nr:hypothetical protein B0H13DRAFT_1864738 [Mycena leptocephala]
MFRLRIIVALLAVVITLVVAKSPELLLPLDSENHRAHRVSVSSQTGGRKWYSLQGVHHKQYKGLASREAKRIQVSSRIMIDRGTFWTVDPDYERPNALMDLLGAGEEERSRLTEDHHPVSAQIEF